MMRALCMLAAAVACGAGIGTACAQSFPSRVIRIITPEAGGASDLASRIIAQRLTASLGQPAIVEGRGIIGVEIALQAQPDGHVLLHYTSPLWILPLFRRNASWEPLRDFTPVALTVSTPSVLVVHPSLPVKTARDLVALAKARPGELNYASSSSGSANHLAAELFKSVAGVKIERIAFKGAAAAITGVISGQPQLMFATAGSVMPHIRSGRLHGLAVTSAETSALAPGLPTLAATGVPGYESQSTTALFALAKTPPAVIARLNEETVRALQPVDVRERLFNAGMEVVANSPQEAAAVIKAEMARMGRLIDEAGLHE